MFKFKKKKLIYGIGINLKTLIDKKCNYKRRT